MPTPTKESFASLALTPFSRQLCAFTTTTLRAVFPRSLHSAFLHRDILAALDTATTRWHATTRRSLRTTPAPTRPSVPPKPLAHGPNATPTHLLPSRLYVLHCLFTQPTFADALAELHADTASADEEEGAAPADPHEQRARLALLVARAHHPSTHRHSDTSRHAPDLHAHYHWFHHHAHDVLRRLGSAPVCARLRASGDPYMTWATTHWARHPNLYDYFVPLNVQLEYETRPVAETRVVWDDPVCSGVVRVHTPQTSVHPRITQQLAYRAVCMAVLGRHPCRHVVLHWYPAAAKKTIAGKAQLRGEWDGGCRVEGCGKSRVTGCKGGRRSERSHTFATTPRPAPTAASALTPPAWTPYEINTGATYRNTCNTVTVWRLEECHKTFCHETIHGFGWDYDVPDAEVREWAVARFAIDPDMPLNIFEAYVETWATLLNTYMVVGYRADTQGAHDARDATIRACLLCEQRWAVFQAAKALHYHGFTTWTSFYTPPSAAGASETSPAPSPSPRFSQSTSVFSYFIVRAAMLWDIAQFLRDHPRVDLHASAQPTGWWRQWFAQLDDVFGDAAFVRAMESCLALHRAAPAHRFAKAHRRGQVEVWNTMRMGCIESF